MENIRIAPPSEPSVSPCHLAGKISEVRIAQREKAKQPRRETGSPNSVSKVNDQCRGCATDEKYQKGITCLPQTFGKLVQPFWKAGRIHTQQYRDKISTTTPSFPDQRHAPKHKHRPLNTEQPHAYNTRYPYRAISRAGRGRRRRRGCD